MDKEKISFQQWAAALTALLNAHPAMLPESTCVVTCSLTEENMRASYDQGDTVEEAYDAIDEHFNRYGW